MHNPIAKPIEVLLVEDNTGDVRLTNLRTGQAQVLNNIAGKDVPAVKADTSLTYLETGSFSWASLIPNEASGFIFNINFKTRRFNLHIDEFKLNRSFSAPPLARGAARAGSRHPTRTLRCG